MEVSQQQLLLALYTPCRSLVYTAAARHIQPSWSFYHRHTWYDLFGIYRLSITWPPVL